jgi:outer membrane protein assembly factor BamB
MDRHDGAPPFTAAPVRPFGVSILIALVGSWVLASDQPPATSVHYERPGAYVRHVVRLEKALRPHSDLVLHLGLQDGTIRQSWAAAPSLPKDADYVDVSGLRVGDARVEGTIKLSVQLPVTEDAAAGAAHVDHVAEYDIDVRLAGKRWSGTYEGWLARRGRLVVDSTEYFIQPHDMRWLAYGEKLTGSIEGDISALARDQGRTAAVLRSYNLIKALPSSRLGNVDFAITFRDGTSQGVELVQGARGAGFDRELDPDDRLWQAQVRTHDVRIRGDRLAGRVAADLTLRKATSARRHTFELEAQLRANSITGRVTNEWDGKTAEEGILGRVSAAGTEAAADVYAMTLRTATLTGRDVHVELVRNDGTFTDGIARGPRYELGQADAGRLQLTDGGLAGELKIHLPVGSGMVTFEPLDVVYDVRVNRGDGRKLSGTYAGVFGRRTMIRGQAVGEAETEKALREHHAMAIARDYPCWIGPNYNFSPLSCGHELVDDLAKARLLWKSEHTPPGRLQTIRYGNHNLTLYLSHGGNDELGCAGGCGSPIVYRGKVYLYYVRPMAGGESGERELALIKRSYGYGHTTWTMRRFWSVRSDDVILCVDGATGQTIWKTVFPDEGPYRNHPLFQGSGKRGAYTSFLAGGDGKVFVHTSAARTVCLDARTGELLWTSPVGNGELRTVVDGTLITLHQDRKCSLVALETQNGRKRWEVPDVGSRSAMPLVWSRGNRNYVIAGSGTGKVVCVEAKTGRTAWQEDAIGRNDKAMTLAGDYLLCNTVLPAKATPQLGAFKISPTGLTKAWTLEKYGYRLKCDYPTAYGGTVYLRRVDVKPNTLVAINVTDGTVLSETAMADGSGSGGQPQYVDTRILVQRDSTHNTTDLNYFTADGHRVKQAGLWTSRHFGTTGYSPVLMTNPIADGRIIIRGGNGIWCYDMRSRTR